MPEDKQLEGTISFWESTLKIQRWLMDVATQTLIEETIKYLKELRGIKDNLERR